MQLRCPLNCMLHEAQAFVERPGEMPDTSLEAIPKTQIDLTVRNSNAYVPFSLR